MVKKLMLEGFVVEQSADKVQTFWEGQKIWKKYPDHIWNCLVSSKKLGDFVAFSEFLNFKKVMVEEFMVEESRVEDWGWKFLCWKFRGWNVMQPLKCPRWALLSQFPQTCTGNIGAGGLKRPGQVSYGPMIIEDIELAWKSRSPWRNVEDCGSFLKKKKKDIIKCSLYLNGESMYSLNVILPALTKICQELKAIKLV